MRELLRRVLADGRCAVISHSTRADGDLSPSTVPAAELARRRTAAVDAGPWHALRQVHGCQVVHLDQQDDDRPEADALVTERDRQVLAVHSGDCVPVGFIHEHGAVGVAHAGWKGLEAGVLATTVAHLRSIAGPGAVHVAVGPHIHAERYEFGADDLDRLMHRFGPQVASTTAQGTPALDLTAATLAALDELAVQVDVVSPDCTAESDDDYWSYRARGEAGRIALVAWLDDA